MASLEQRRALVTEPAQYLREYGPATLEWAAAYLERVGSLPVLAQVQPGEVTARLPGSAPEQGESFDAVLRDLEEILLPGITHWQHPRFFAYFPSATSAPAILADLIASTLNAVGFLWRSSPAATELEGVVCSWVAQLLGLPDGWHGHIEGGASLATMTAAIAARERTGRGVLVCSQETHSSAAKAAQMVGMQTRTVSCDADGGLRVEELGDLSDAAVVVATVGTTGRGAIDPVPAIADACESAGAWLHVDGAYAGTAMVCPELRWAFAGVERADSLVVNAHKWMLTPVDCSLLWTRHADAFRNAFSLVPEYLRTPSVEDALSLNEYGPALGRRFRALKLWAVLRCYGREGLREHVRAGVEMAAAFESWVRAANDWEVVSARHFALVCLRHAGSDEFNQTLLERVNASGDAFLSHTVIEGRYVLRIAAGGLLTTPGDMELTWEALKREAASLR
ncbi:MAG: pyridoxal phosphate-dependent decarboxylase family protein [Solirubrobacteraceae bacterium]